MTWDHVRGEKRFTIGEGICGRSEAEILREIEKCELVCVNCHRRREELRRLVGHPAPSLRRQAGG